VRLNQETSNCSWVALAVWTPALSMWTKVKCLRVVLQFGCTFSASGLNNSSRKNAESNVLLLGVSNSVRSREFPSKWPACAFRLQLSFWYGLIILRQPEAK
jgi:hypothetical protein